ncbi:cysteine hydrolase [Candidatus Woesearchaeota archaeon]|jgi:nicotinamidase/pyrazinamidase|nr:cysteine hydrolase [Candidatus Woesearchaeota archaeon]MBT3537998.1 cysteine hydrolase [Candidatus Woesearchaeota archaeon]MBT4697352.1 cysteine hydrolase [Candidatus Woesearchaeota archaeon]MBT4717073.1 cysteine hydrolase [Candidatus Woesearchaeota archaeon]MBT7105667.1 cysteine hydrolase [Candidatus Woesearchaeota archaeon]
MKTIFWNVDTQYDFMRSDDSFKGTLPVEGARSIEPNLEKLTELAENEDIKVVNSADWHNKDSAEFSDEPNYQTTFPPHCLTETKGADYVPSTQPKDAYKVDWQQESVDAKAVTNTRNIVLYKDAFDVFEGNPHTEEVLSTIAPDRAIVYGVATNVCVDFAVQGLLERGVEVYVPTDAIKELPGLPLEATLDAWQQAGALLTTTDEVSNYI